MSLLGLVLFEPAFEECDGVKEVVVELEQQVDVVEVFLAREAVGQVVVPNQILVEFVAKLTLYGFWRVEGWFAVPNQILVEFVAKLTLYGFWRVEGWFAELLSILAKHGATGLGGLQVALRIGGIGSALA